MPWQGLVRPRFPLPSGGAPHKPTATGGTQRKQERTARFLLFTISRTSV
jgi:hypothetical protein